MTSCKDCIHYEVCRFKIDKETGLTINECDHGFKHKDQYVKLPAYLGQIVYAADVHVDYRNKIHSAVDEGKVSMLQQKVDGSWKIRISWYKRIQGSQDYYTSHSADYTIKEFSAFYAIKEAAEIKREEVVNKYIMELKANTKEN